MDKTQPSAELTIRLVDDNAGFLAMESAWNRLSGDVPFRSFQWYRTWWQHFKADHRLLVLAVYDAETCVGIAPLFVERILSLGRVAQFLGSGLVASDQQTILALPPYANAIGRAISDWFASDQNTLADLLQLDGIANDCPAFNAFGIAAQQAGYSFIESSTIHTWRIELPSTTDDYLAGLSKSCRRKIRSALKKFESSELTVSIADSPSSFETSWDCFVGLHQRRRISLGEEGLFRDPVFHHFLYDISKSSFHAGGLDLVTVSSADGPIATELCFRSETGSYAYQLGVNPDCLKQNPGWLINAASIRHAINLGLSHFDLCRGDFDYKRQMGARATVCKRIRITPPRLRSQVLNAFITNGTAVRNWCLNNLHTTPLQT